MTTYTPEELAEVLRLHDLWLRCKTDGKRAYLRNANLYNANLMGAYLKGAYLSMADLRNANLQGANLQRAYLTGADIRNANLKGASLSMADLTNADLKGANLSNAKLKGANLSNAKLNGVRMAWNSHALISERLWQAAGTDIDKQMVAAYIGRAVNRCWDDFIDLQHPETKWVLDTMRGWILPDEEPPIHLKH